MSKNWCAVAYLLFLIPAMGNAEIIVRAKLLAYRPAEIVRQVPSHVLNKEAFLFSPVDARAVSARTIKVIHEHSGQSKVPDAANSEGVVYELRLQRKKSCDEPFESYVKNSPRLVPSQTAMEPPPVTGGVLFLNGGDPTNIPGKERLPCYVLLDGTAMGTTRR